MNTAYRFVHANGREVVLEEGIPDPVAARMSKIEVTGGTVRMTCIVPDHVGVPVANNPTAESAASDWRVLEGSSSPGWPAPGSVEHELANAIWTASRYDEGTISATGANHVARAVLANRANWDTDVELGEALAAWGARTGSIREGGSGATGVDRVENIALAAEAQGNHLSAIALRYMAARMRRMAR